MNVPKDLLAKIDALAIRTRRTRTYFVVKAMKTLLKNKKDREE